MSQLQYQYDLPVRHSLCSALSTFLLSLPSPFGHDQSRIFASLWLSHDEVRELTGALTILASLIIRHRLDDYHKWSCQALLGELNSEEPMIASVELQWVEILRQWWADEAMWPSELLVVRGLRCKLVRMVIPSRIYFAFLTNIYLNQSFPLHAEAGFKFFDYQKAV